MATLTKTTKALVKPKPVLKKTITEHKPQIMGKLNSFVNVEGAQTILSFTRAKKAI